MPRRYRVAKLMNYLAWILLAPTVAGVVAIIFFVAPAHAFSRLINLAWGWEVVCNVGGGLCGLIAVFCRDWWVPAVAIFLHMACFVVFLAM